MAMRRRIPGWLIPFLAAMLAVTACGDDGGAATQAESEAESESESESESELGDSNEGSGTTEDGETPDATATDADPVTPVATGEVDCEKLEAALDSAGAMVGGDQSLLGSNPEQQFAEARATMLALKEQAPEIAADVDQTLAGLAAISDAFAEIGWDTDFESDPAAAVALVQLAFGDPAVAGMMTSTANIGTWLSTNCGS